MWANGSRGDYIIGGSSAVFSGARMVVHAVVWITLLLNLTGCGGTPIAEDLSQPQAHEIVAFLHGAGIDAASERESGGRARYSVAVRKSSYGEAIALLQSKGLPSPQKLSFQDLIEQRGLIPNSREIEALRVDHALSLQIENLLSEHPGVESAKVVVRAMSSQVENSSSVSVVVQERAAANLNRTELLDLIVTAAPNIPKERIMLSVTKLSADQEATSEKSSPQDYLVPFLGFWRVPAADYNRLAMTLVGCLLLTGLVSAVLGYGIAYLKMGRDYTPHDNQELSLKTIRSDRTPRDLLEP